jgi:DNA-binding SARP family transcriptional activator/TolB-like protein
MSNSVQRSSARLPQPDDTGMAVMRLRLIGQMEAVTATGESVLPAGRKTRALLAVIALSAPRPALRGRLAELIWSRRPEEQARASLRQEIHRLLEALSFTDSEILSVTRDHLSLRAGAVWIDVEAVMRATSTDPAALELLDGDLLEDLDGIDPNFDAWLTTERERLRDRARTVAEALLREQADPEAAIAAAQRLLIIDRAHEGAWRALMRGYADRGERGMAIQAYDRCRAVLADLLDAAPSSETQKLLVDIRGPARSRMPARPAAPVVPLLPAPSAGPQAAPLVLAFQADDAMPDGPPAPRAAAPASPGFACVSVVPFRMVGTAEEETHLATGLAEEITAALARFRGMVVISPAALGRFAQDSRDEAAIRRASGVDFLLDGTIQRERERLRITLQLLDLRAGDQVVWVERFDRQTRDLLCLQDEIAAAAAARIDSEILLLEARRAAGRPLAGDSAHELVLRALPPLTRLVREPFMEAGACLARAIELQPEYAAAHAWYAFWHVVLIAQGWSDDVKATVRTAGELSERAVIFDPQDARALAIAGHVRAYMYRRPREATALHERSLALNPNLATAWAMSAATCAYMGETHEAELRCNRYKALSPLDPFAFMFDGFATLIHLLKRDHEAAVATGRSVTQMAPMSAGGFRPYLAALGHLGRTQEASIARRRVLTLEPGSPLERHSDKQHVAEGLRLAGIRETAE